MEKKFNFKRFNIVHCTFNCSHYKRLNLVYISSHIAALEVNNICNYYLVENDFCYKTAKQGISNHPRFCLWPIF